VNAGRPSRAAARTRDEMMQMLSASQPRVTITGYTDIPSVLSCPSAGPGHARRSELPTPRASMPRCPALLVPS
jgi:hypothetical protein